MKHTFLIAVLATAMGLSTSASVAQPQQGQDSAKLGVTTDISAPSCSFDLNGGMAVNLGIINPGTLLRDHSKELPRQKVNLNIVCEAMTMLTLSIVDTYADAVSQGPHPYLFQGSHGLSRQFALVDAQNSGNLIGSYIMHMTDTYNSLGIHYNIHGMNNGFWGDFLRSSKSDQDRTPETAIFTDLQGNHKYTKDLTIEFAIVPQILPTSKLNSEINSVVDVAGETTFKVVYM